MRCEPLLGSFLHGLLRSALRKDLRMEMDAAGAESDGGGMNSSRQARIGMTKLLVVSMRFDNVGREGKREGVELVSRRRSPPPCHLNCGRWWGIWGSACSETTRTGTIGLRLVVWRGEAAVVILMRRHGRIGRGVDSPYNGIAIAVSLLHTYNWKR